MRAQPLVQPLVQSGSVQMAENTTVRSTNDVPREF